MGMIDFCNILREMVLFNPLILSNEIECFFFFESSAVSKNELSFRKTWIVYFFIFLLTAI